MSLSQGLNGEAIPAAFVGPYCRLLEPLPVAEVVVPSPPRGPSALSLASFSGYGNDKPADQTGGGSGRRRRSPFRLEIPDDSSPRSDESPAGSVEDLNSLLESPAGRKGGVKPGNHSRRLRRHHSERTRAHGGADVGSAVGPKDLVAADPLGLVKGLCISPGLQLPARRNTVTWHSSLDGELQDDCADRSETHRRALRTWGSMKELQRRHAADAEGNGASAPQPPPLPRVPRGSGSTFNSPRLGAGSSALHVALPPPLLPPLEIPLPEGMPSRACRRPTRSWGSPRAVAVTPRGDHHSISGPSHLSLLPSPPGQSRVHRRPTRVWGSSRDLVMALDLQALEGKLQLLQRQRELSAHKCDVFLKEMEVFWKSPVGTSLALECQPGDRSIRRCSTVKVKLSPQQKWQYSRSRSSNGREVPPRADLWNL